MRDYDPTTGRYVQADPLELVDGASVYGYALQNPGRYVDPRGEFGVFGAIGGAAVSFGLQFGVNFLIENLSWQDSLKCVNLMTAANAAALGFTGFTPGSLVKSAYKTRSKGVLAGAAGIAGASSQINGAFPDLTIGDLAGGECDCDKSLPQWAKKLRDTIL